jgi:hypothetical protein
MPSKPKPPAKSLLTCPKCKQEMRLLGIEAETNIRELYTFECKKRRRLEIRGVRVN